MNQDMIRCFAVLLAIIATFPLALSGQSTLSGGIGSGDERQGSDDKQSKKISDLLAMEDLRVVATPICAINIPSNYKEVKSVAPSTVDGTTDGCGLNSAAVFKIAQGWRLKPNDPGLEVAGSLDVISVLASVEATAAHLVEYQGARITRELWLLCGRAGTWTCHPANKGSDPRLFGLRQLGLVYIHINTTADPSKPFDYYAGIQKRTPANIQHLLDLLRLAAIPIGAQAAGDTTSVLYGAGIIDRIPVPSDVTLFGAMQSENNAAMIGNEFKIDNEGQYWWDVSVAVPINKLTLLDYGKENGVFEPKAVNKQSIYGLLNLNPWAVLPKLKTSPKVVSYLPRPVVGIGVTGRPGDNFVLGGTFGFRWAQFFVGSGFAKQSLAIPNAAVGKPQTTERYGSRLVYGLNIPVGRAIEKLSSKAK